MLEQTVHSLRERPEEIDRLVVDQNAVHKGSEIGIIGIVAIDHTGKCGDRSGEIEIRRIGELLNITNAIFISHPVYAAHGIVCILHTYREAALFRRICVGFQDRLGIEHTCHDVRYGAVGGMCVML